MALDDYLYRLSGRHQIVVVSFVLVLGNLALSIHKSCRVYLFEQAQCLIYYRLHDPQQIKTLDGVDESLCKLEPIQYPLSIIVGIDACLSFIPVLLVLATYEQFLPRVGLRHLAILSLACSAAGVLFSTTIFWTQQGWAIYVAPLSFTFDLIGGGELVRIGIITTCIAELSAPEQLTKTYNYLSGAYLLAGVGGAAAGSMLLSNHVYLLNALSIACFVLTISIAMLISLGCGRNLTASRSEYDPVPLEASASSHAPLMPSPPLTPSRLSGTLSRADTQRPLLQLVFRTWHASYYSLLTLFQVPNPTFTVVLLILINGLALNIQVLLPQYTSLALHWPLATVNAILALKSLVSALVLFTLPTLRKSYLEPRMSTLHIDLFIAQASIVANSVGMMGLGFSTSAALFILSLCIFTGGSGLGDSLCAFGTLSLPPGETVTEFYTRFGLVQTLAGIAGAPLWSGILSLVLKSAVLPLGLPFLLCACLFGSGLFGIGRVRQGMRVETREFSVHTG